MCASHKTSTKDSEIPQAMQTPPLLNSDDDATTAESVQKKGPHSAVVKAYLEVDGYGISSLTQYLGIHELITRTSAMSSI